MLSVWPGTNMLGVTSSEFIMTCKKHVYLKLVVYVIIQLSPLVKVRNIHKVFVC